MKLFLIQVLFFCQTVFSQTAGISGMVINSEDNSKLASASIFINNSSIGTASGPDGKFTLNGITRQTADLVVSYTGFKTVSIKISPADIGRYLIIKMIPRKETLEEISVMMPEKDGWKTWGKFFSKSFLGQSEFAKKCVIENPKVIQFFNDKKNGQLKAYSKGPLIIRNYALRYLLKFQLEEYKYDFKNKIFTYVGYHSFSEMKTSSNRKRNLWLKNRKEAYYGSVMHFMRALFEDSVAEQGFDVREEIRINHTDSNFKKIYLPGTLPLVRIGSQTYKVLPGEIPIFKKTPDYVDLINIKKFSFKDATVFDSSTHQKEFYFENYLQVIYRNALCKKDYLIFNHLPEFLALDQTSDVYLVSKDPLITEKDGSYSDPVNMMNSGYWGWCKIAEMLPTNYNPGD